MKIIIICLAYFWQNNSRSFINTNSLQAYNHHFNIVSGTHNPSIYSHFYKLKMKNEINSVKPFNHYRQIKNE